MHQDKKYYLQLNHILSPWTRQNWWKILAEGGIDVNQKFKLGLTPIVTAILGNNAKIVKYCWRMEQIWGQMIHLDELFFVTHTCVGILI